MTKNYVKKVLLGGLLLIVAVGSLGMSPARAAGTFPKPASGWVNATPNPCANSSNGHVPIYTSAGVFVGCQTDAGFEAMQASAQGSGSWVNVACSSGGTELPGGPPLCNTSSSASTYSQMYEDCITSGLQVFGLCDSSGLSQSLITDFLPGADWISAAIAVADTAYDISTKQLGWPTLCDAVSVAGVIPNTGAAADLATALIGSTCDQLQEFGGTGTAPTIQLSAPQTNGLAVSINGVTLPTTSGATIQKILWNWGDGSPVSSAWFPAKHTYASAGSYKATATAVDSNNLTQSAGENLTVLTPGMITELTNLVFANGGSTTTIPSFISGTRSDGLTLNSTVAQVYAVGDPPVVLVRLLERYSTPTSDTVGQAFIALYNATNGSSQPTSLSVSCSASPSSPAVGQTITWTAQAQGGVAPYAYRWQNGSTVTSYSTSYSTAATVSNSVTVTDSVSNQASYSCPITVTTPVIPTIKGITVSPSSISPGTTATVQITLSGAAPAGGASIALTSSAGPFPIPSTYTVPAGQSSVSFPVTAQASGAGSAVVTATYNGTTVQFTIFLTGS